MLEKNNLSGDINAETSTKIGENIIDAYSCTKLKLHTDFKNANSPDIIPFSSADNSQVTYLKKR